MRSYSCQIQQRTVQLLRVRKERCKCNHQEEADVISRVHVSCGPCSLGDIFVKIISLSIIDKAIKMQRSIRVSFIFIVLLYP